MIKNLTIKKGNNLQKATKFVRLSMKKKNIKSFFNNITKRSITTIKNFWTCIKSFLTKNGFLENKVNAIFEGNKILTSKKVLVKTANE